MQGIDGVVLIVRPLVAVQYLHGIDGVVLIVRRVVPVGINHGIDELLIHSISNMCMLPNRTVVMVPMRVHCGECECDSVELPHRFIQQIEEIPA